MKKKIANFELEGLFPYLLTRAKLRFFSKEKREFVERKIKILGQIVALDLTDLEQKYLAKDCVREPENLIVYRAIAASGMADTFIDIGANCGHVALSVINDYKQVLLFEPNPKLAVLLRTIFTTQKNVTIRECAIVDSQSAGAITLSVPDDSSGLATLGGTNLSKQHKHVHTYTVKAATMEAEVEGFSVENAYIKIDVEGFEVNIIQSAKDLINGRRPIVGFEALSKSSALSCARIFNDYVFYCARFDFLENGGALSKSIFGMSKALVCGGNIKILKLDNLAESSLDNFSQIFSVPRELAERFEDAMRSYSVKTPIFNLNKLKTWS